MKIALVTLMDDGFMISYRGFWQSLIYHNPWFTWDFVVLDNGLSEENKREIKRNHKNTFIKKIDKKAYCDVKFKKTHPKLQATYYTFDAFACGAYDRIVFMDMDITILGDIKDLFKCSYGFAACRAYNAKTDTLTDRFNSGVFVVQKEYLTNSVYRSLINISKRGFSMPDQRTLNSYFKDNVHWLPKKYNVEKRMMNTKNHTDIWDEKVCLHWVANKPWDKEKDNDIERSFVDLEKIWWKYYNMRGSYGTEMERSG